MCADGCCCAPLCRQATSALDAQSEALVQEALERMKPRTRVVGVVSMERIVLR